VRNQRDIEKLFQGYIRLSCGKVSSYWAWGRSLSGCVTTLTFWDAAWRNASTTVAQLPNGTVSSQRTYTACVSGRATARQPAVQPRGCSPACHLGTRAPAINGDDHARFGQFLHRFRFRHIHVDARLQNRRGDHENNQQHQHTSINGTMLISESVVRFGVRRLAWQ